MAVEEARDYVVTIPAGTVEAAPAVTSIEMPARQVLGIRWRIPPGSLGLMGWRLTMGGVQVLPSAGAAWIVASGEAGTYAVRGLPDSGAWQVTAYNTGAYQHSIYLTFTVAVPSRAPQLRAPMAAGLLSSAPDLSHAGPPLRPGR